MRDGEFVLLCLAFIILAVWVLMGGKFSPICRPRRFPRRFWRFSIPFFVLWVFQVGANGSNPFVSLAAAWLSILTPFFIFLVPVYVLVLTECWKETNLFRRLAILGQKQGTGRFGGILEYFKNDCTDLVHRTTPAGAPLQRESMFYLGKTGFEYDYQLGGRHIGIKGENHKLIVAQSGYGKSRDCLTAALTMWQGGGVVFDIKGEHWNTVIKHKAADKYLFDPFGVTGDESAVGWNPLLEIDPKSDTAREDIRRMCMAVFVKAKHDAGVHFREIGMKLLRGLVAHVISTYPPEQRNLGTVYDLFRQGYPKDSEPPKTKTYHTVEENGEQVRKERLHPDGSPVMRTLTPEECWNKLIKEMMENEACQGAAKEGASEYLKTEKSERSGLLTTTGRAIDWINNKRIRTLLCAQDSFSLDVVKKDEAWICVAIPEKYLEENMLFVRLFYQRALDAVDNFTTPNAEEHKRRMMFLLEEFDKFGFEFTPAIDLVNFKRSSRVMGVFVLQNLGQLRQRYDNID
ncbi:MAG: type IV secretory system conjugative DNA transfer family protein, partial [Alphaproteobacteria bacterium]|nr:type IV secretory system conjugative DNA transfer family protein [Alphaproteobacteria bacterium]